MNALRNSIFRVLGLSAIFLAAFISIAALTANTAYAIETEDETWTESTEAAEDTVSYSEDEPQEGDVVTLKSSGLTEENGKLYYYNEDGSLFTDGYKEITIDGTVYYYYFQNDGSAFTDGYKPFDKNGTRVYYYFQKDGSAYTGGYLNFVQGGKQYYFYFQNDGSAFTGGYKEITIDGTLYYFYFLANGQGFNTGYKTVMIDGKKYYFYFGSDGRAVTDTIEAIPLGTRTAYFLFQTNGTAYTGGYKEVADGNKTDYYYFLQNGQAYTTGYKTVLIDGITYYFYFENSGKAFTGGLKEISFGTQSYYYFFQNTGKALTSDWNTVNGTKYYMQANGRAAKGWFCVGDGYYYADSNSAILTDRVVEGYKLDSTGKSTTKYRIVQYVNEHTNSSMTNQQKIEALYDWILNNDMIYIRTYEHTSSSWVWTDSWVDDMAASLMDNGGGNCFRYAAFSGMLIHEATGLPVTVYRGTTPGSSVSQTPHGWVTVYQDGAWYSYDIELHKFSHYARSRCYKVLYSKSNGVLYFSGVGTDLY